MSNLLISSIKLDIALWHKICSKFLSVSTEGAKMVNKPAIQNKGQHIASIQLSSSQSYWDQFYSDASDCTIRLEPSQFAAFCLTEMKNFGVNRVIELGSGNGRDALFFASHGLKVIATDNSPKAVTSIKNKIQKFHDTFVFEYDVRNDFPYGDFKEDGISAIYARFFIHALDETALQGFFTNISKVLKPDEFMFLEYRNDNDVNKPKLTSPHFRAFYPSEKIEEYAKTEHFNLIYEVSGQGFAKLKHDDASVTRQIFQFKG